MWGNSSSLARQEQNYKEIQARKPAFKEITALTRNSSNKISSHYIIIYYVSSINIKRLWIDLLTYVFFIAGARCNPTLRASISRSLKPHRTSLYCFVSYKADFVDRSSERSNGARFASDARSLPQMESTFLNRKLHQTAHVMLIAVRIRLLQSLGGTKVSRLISFGLND